MSAFSSRSAVGSIPSPSQTMSRAGDSVVPRYPTSGQSASSGARISGGGGTLHIHANRPASAVPPPGTLASFLIDAADLARLIVPSSR